jgi:hypothetical protein
MSRPARVLVCFLGAPPEEEVVHPDPGLPGHLGGLMDLIGGPVESVPLDGGVRLWCSQGGLYPGLPLNRCVPRDSQLPPGFEDADPARLAAEMALAAHLEVHGEFVLARATTRRRAWRS